MGGVIWAKFHVLPWNIVLCGVTVVARSLGSCGKERIVVQGQL